MLLVPIAKAVGENLPGNQANLLIFITGLVCSTGMGMPVSGFPNQTAYVPPLYCQESNLFSIRATQEDDMGQLYLTNVDFLKNGIPASVIAALVCVAHPSSPWWIEQNTHHMVRQVVASLGYTLMKLVGSVFFLFFLLRFSLCRSPGSCYDQSGLTSRLSKDFGLRMPHSNPLGTFGLRVPRAHISLASLIYPNVIRPGTIERMVFNRVL